MLFVCFGACAAGAQSLGASGTPNRPAILGSLEQGKYSNPVIGFEIQLDPSCAYADESRAIAMSTEFPQRLNLPMVCRRAYLVLFMSYPLQAEEEANLPACCWSQALQGVIEGGGLKKRGDWQNLKVGETDVLVQEVIRPGDSGDQPGFYYAFLVGRRYVSLLALGLRPEANRTELSKIAATLRIEPSLSHQERNSDGVSGTPIHPEILGSLEQGKYSNRAIGFEIQLNPTCAAMDESQAIAFSTELPQRLNLPIRCGRGNLVDLGSSPLHADEEANLLNCASPSLLGVIDAGDFKKRGSWKSLKIGGTDVLVQELVRHGDSGNQVGFYYAFLVGRRYVSIFALGPEANRTELSNIAATLKIARPQ
jgi:hypothetical protein